MSLLPEPKKPTTKPINLFIQGLTRIDVRHKQNKPLQSHQPIVRPHKTLVNPHNYYSHPQPQPQQYMSKTVGSQNLQSRLSLNKQRNSKSTYQNPNPYSRSNNHKRQSLANTKSYSSHHQVTNSRVKSETKSHDGSRRKSSIKKSQSIANIQSSQNHSLSKLPRKSDLCLNNNYLMTTSSSSVQEVVKQARKALFRKQMGQIVEGLQHSNHIHLNESICFLDSSSLLYILSSMKYYNPQDPDHIRLAQMMWKALGGMSFGGFLISNLYIVLQIVEGFSTGAPTSVETPMRLNTMQRQTIYELPLKETLELNLSDKDCRLIYVFFHSFKMHREDDCFKNAIASVKNHSKTPANVSSNKNKERMLRNLSSHNIARPNILTPSPTNKGVSQKHDWHKENKSPDSNLNYLAQNTNSILNPRKSDHKSRNWTAASSAQSEKPKVIVQNKQNYSSTHSYLSNAQSSNYLNPLNINQELIDRTVNQKRDILPPKYLEPELPLTLPQPKPKSVPILSVDVNLGEGQTEKIIVYEGQTAQHISYNLAKKYDLNEEMRQRFEGILNSHISGLLTRIEQLPQETMSQVSRDDFGM